MKFSAMSWALVVSVAALMLMQLHTSAAPARQDTSQRIDPYKNFKFRVRVDGRYVAGANNISGLEAAPEVVKHREGGDPSTSRKSPGRNKFAPIILERGLTQDLTFEQWASQPSRSDHLQKDIVIDVYDEGGRIVASYKIFSCWVSEYKAVPKLGGDANAIAIEHIKLENEGWERDL